MKFIGFEDISRQADDYLRLLEESIDRLETLLNRLGGYSSRYFDVFNRKAEESSRRNLLLHGGVQPYRLIHSLVINNYLFKGNKLFQVGELFNLHKKAELNRMECLYSEMKDKVLLTRDQDVKARGEMPWLQVSA